MVIVPKPYWFIIGRYSMSRRGMSQVFCQGLFMRANRTRPTDEYRFLQLPLDGFPNQPIIGRNRLHEHVVFPLPYCRRPCGPYY